MKGPIENTIYAAIIGICEERENSGAYRGNGHHLAQELTAKVSEALLSKQQKEIFDCLSKLPKSVKEISIACNMPSKQVSSQLIQMNKNTLLVHFKKNGRLKLWYK